jgi:AraC family transcriptional regulator
MPLQTQSDVKYASSELLSGCAEWDALRVEHRQVPGGAHNPVTSSCTELVIILSGRAIVSRTGDGQRQQRVAVPGSSWLVPAGTHETQLELDAPLGCLHLFMPATVLEHSALADYDIDPDKIQLAYVGGVTDPVLAQLGSMLHDLVRRDLQPGDRIFCDSVRTAIAARLIGHYTVDRWRTPARAPSLDRHRLARVLEFIEAHLADDISLDDMAGEACLSPFHFARLFRAAMGVPPHSYVSARRIEAAKAKLATDKATLAQIALEAGFASQASFTRAFGKATSMTPGQYRALCVAGAQS